jgi:hypothetical protein
VEIYIIYSIALVEMILRSLRLMATYPPAGRSIDKSEPTIASFCKPMIDLTSIEAPACRVENSRVLALSSCLGRLVDSDFFGPS